VSKHYTYDVNNFWVVVEYDGVTPALHTFTALRPVEEFLEKVKRQPAASRLVGLSEPIALARTILEKSAVLLYHAAKEALEAIDLGQPERTERALRLLRRTTALAALEPKLGDLYHATKTSIRYHPLPKEEPEHSLVEALRQELIDCQRQAPAEG
jgi:hypothetical protein